METNLKLQEIPAVAGVIILKVPFCGNDLKLNMFNFRQNEMFGNLILL
jgi:hypothetical protein